MIAYLIGGPQDMLKMHVCDNALILTFPHLAANVIQKAFKDSPPSGLVEVENLHYVKVYESPSREPFAVYVLRGEQYW